MRPLGRRLTVGAQIALSGVARPESLAHLTPTLSRAHCDRAIPKGSGTLRRGLTRLRLRAGLKLARISVGGIRRARHRSLGHLPPWPRSTRARLRAPSAGSTERRRAPRVRGATCTRPLSSARRPESAKPTQHAAAVVHAMCAPRWRPSLLAGKKKVPTYFLSYFR